MLTTLQNPFKIDNPSAPADQCISYSIHYMDGASFPFALVAFNPTDRTLKIDVNVAETNIDDLLNLIDYGAIELKIRAFSTYNTDVYSQPFKLVFRCHSE